METKQMRGRATLSLAIFFLTLSGLACGKQESTPARSEPAGPPPRPSMQPPPPQQPSLYVVPLNQNEFSMETIQANKKMIEQEPENVKALLGLGDANFMIQRFEVAKGYYERALKADPKQTNARISLSNCLIFMQKPDEAIKELDTLLTIETDLAEALYNKGLILLLSKGDTGGAKKAWSRLIEINGSHPLAKQVEKEIKGL